MSQASSGGTKALPVAEVTKFCEFANDFDDGRSEEQIKQAIAVDKINLCGRTFVCAFLAGLQPPTREK